jgi:A/G-specific adenine glycosylase
VSIELKRDLLAWYATAHTRAARDLPWRKTRDPYAIWVSDTMLQQTRVATAIPYWERFLRELPTVYSLAEAPEERVLALWSGLGYYRRARMLHAAAKRVVSSYEGRLPRDAEALRALEGIGDYTAGAVASIAFKQRVAAVDGNVARVLTRVLAIEDARESPKGKARVRAAADALAAIDEGDPGDWTQALMELGALVCTPRQPRCRDCPVRARCAAFARGIAADLPRKAPSGSGNGYGNVRASAQPVVHLVAIVLSSGRADRRAVLLARRRADALFGGLWEPPLAPRSGARALAARLGVKLGVLEKAGDVVHVLSHRRMHVRVLRGPLPRKRTFALPGPDYAAIERVPYREIPTRAHATLTRKVLDVANAGQTSLF